MDYEEIAEAKARFKAAGVLMPPDHLAEKANMYVEEWIVAATTATRLDEVELIFGDLVSETEFNRVSEVADDCPF